MNFQTDRGAEKASLSVIYNTEYEEVIFTYWHLFCICRL